MTVARDAVLESATFTTTSPHTFTFTPVGTPKGILVFVAHGTVSTDLINGAVTYGGVAMTRIATNGFAQATAGEVGASYAYFLGSSIPTGAQTVSITHTGSADVKWAICASMTAAADTEVGASGKLENTQTSPQLALDTGGTSSLRYCILYSGTNAPGNAAVLTGMEANTIGVSHDFGAFSAVLGQQTDAVSGSFTIGFTLGVTDTAFIAAAIQEAGGTQPLTGTLFTKAPTFPVGVVTGSGSQALSGSLFTKAPSFFVGSLAPPLTEFPIRQQISNFLTGTSIPGVLRVAPLEDNIVFAVVSAATTLANMTGPSGYTKAAEEEGDGVSIQLWYKRAGAAESATVTVTSSVSVALKIHVFESPTEMFPAGDPIDVVDTNDSSTTAVTTLSAGTTAAVGQANTFAIAAVTALGGNTDFLLVDWSDGFSAVTDHDTRGLMVAYKAMTAVEAATATATWNQVTAPTTHKAAGLVATFEMAVRLVLPSPTPKRVSSGSRRDNLNTTGTVDTVATFPIVANHLYLAFVATSKTGGNDGDAVIPTSHGGGLTWTLHESHFIGLARRVHVFRAMSGSDLSAASISITTPEIECAFWWTVLDVTGVDLSGTNGSGAIRQVASGDEPTGDTFVEVSLDTTPLITGAVVAICMHGVAERQLIDNNPVHVLFAESDIGDPGQRATADWYQGSDDTFRWEWASSIHALAIIAELAVPIVGVSQTPNATVSNVGWDTAPLAGQAIHTYIATDDTDYITVTVP